MNDLKGKRLLILGGSRDEIDAVRAAKEEGVFVGVTDYYDTRRSPAKLIADKYYDISIADIDALLELIEKEKYDGVLTGFTDSYLKFYADLTKKAGLPYYATKQQLTTFTNKDIYKKLFEKYNVPTLKPYDPNSIKKDFKDFPIILKPTDGSGGKGLNIVYSYDEYIEDMKERDLLKEDLTIKEGHETDIVIERYLKKRKELTAFFVIIDGKSYYMGSANRFLSEMQGDKIGLPILYTYFSSAEDIFEKNVAPQLNKLFEGEKLQNGIMFAQCFLLDNNDIFVYDLGYRLTGTHEYKWFDRMYDLNTMKMLINQAITGKMYDNKSKLLENMEKVKRKKKIAVNVTVLARKGIIKHIKGRDEILKLPYIIDMQMNKAEGNEITDKMIGTLAQITSRIFFVADNLEDIQTKLDEIYGLIDIIDENGNSMIVQNMDYNEIIDEYNYRKNK